MQPTHWRSHSPREVAIGLADASREPRTRFEILDTELTEFTTHLDRDLLPPTSARTRLWEEQP